MDGDTVEVWRVNLRVHDWWRDLGTLSAEERARAERFAFERDRRRFVVARAALRAIVGAHLQEPPSHVRFTIESHGKPRLAGDYAVNVVRFNVSHSAELALIAIVRDRDVGVDVERIRSFVDLDDIAFRHFSEEERRTLRHAASDDRLALFFRYWTLKEAYVKARGLSLHSGLDAVDVSAAGDEPIVLTGGSAGPPPTRWAARTLSIEPGYAAALVVEGGGGYSVVISDFARLTSTDTPHTVVTSISPNG